VTRLQSKNATNPVADFTLGTPNVVSRTPAADLVLTASELPDSDAVAYGRRLRSAKATSGADLGTIAQTEDTDSEDTDSKDYKDVVDAFNNLAIPISVDGYCKVNKDSPAYKKFTQDMLTRLMIKNDIKINNYNYSRTRFKTNKSTLINAVAEELYRKQPK